MTCKSFMTSQICEHNVIITLCLSWHQTQFEFNQEIWLIIKDYLAEKWLEKIKTNKRGSSRKSKTQTDKANDGQTEGLPIDQTEKDGAPKQGDQETEIQNSSPQSKQVQNLDKQKEKESEKESEGVDDTAESTKDTDQSNSGKNLDRSTEANVTEQVEIQVDKIITGKGVKINSDKQIVDDEVGRGKRRMKVIPDSSKNKRFRSRSRSASKARSTTESETSSDSSSSSSDSDRDYHRKKRKRSRKWSKKASKRYYKEKRRRKNRSRSRSCSRRAERKSAASRGYDSSFDGDIESHPDFADKLEPAVKRRLSDLKDKQQKEVSSDEDPTGKLKSPSDSMLYTPAVKRRLMKAGTEDPRNDPANSPNQLNNVNLITEFLKCARLDNSVVESGRESGTEVEKGRAAKTNQSEDEVERARQEAERVILEAEKYKAELNPNGKSLNNDTNTRAAMQSMDDDFFHITCHVEESLRSKCAKGEFVELEKLLPKVRPRGRNEAKFDQKFELVT